MASPSEQEGARGSHILDAIHDNAAEQQGERPSPDIDPREKSTTSSGSASITKNVTTVMSRAHDPSIRIEDEYDLEASMVLGTGFCGNVIMGKSKVTGQRVAVKVCEKRIRNGDETQAEVMARVRAECEIYLNVDHPNIVRLRDMYETDEAIYLVCDCCTGGEMYDRLLKRGQYDEAAAAAATKGMLLAVSYVHNTMNIVHRDLKLQNWLYPNADSADDEVKLIDFGFSKVLQDAVATRAVTAGTVEYLAPELLHHESAVEYPGDMWAVGVIVFMLLGGYPPFSGKNNNEIIAAIRKHEIKWFRSRFAQVSSEAKSFVLSLLEKDPTKRATARQALSHPWIRRTDVDGKAAPENILNGDVLDALASFRQKTAFEKAVAMIMAQCLGRSEVAAMEKIFMSLDATREGSVQLWELREALRKVAEKDPTRKGLDQLANEVENHAEIDEGKLSQIFDDLDYNHDHHIYFSDFLTAVVSCKIDQGSDKLIKATFDRFDVDNSGMISIQNLQNLFGAEFRDVPVLELIKEVDLNGDQLISFDEFKYFIKKRRGLSKQTKPVLPQNESAVDRVEDL